MLDQTVVIAKHLGTPFR